MSYSANVFQQTSNIGSEERISSSRLVVMEKISVVKWIGTALVLLGVAVLFSWDALINSYLRKELTLSPTSKVYASWSKSIVPIMLDIYLFNVTNPEELGQENFKPHLQEVGPFRFNEIQTKVNVTWNDNGTVTYRQQRNWYFDPEHSGPSLDSNLTMLNLPPVIASYGARNWGLFQSWGLSASLKMFEKSIWTTRTANEFLFEGYADPLLTLSSIFSKPQKDRVGFFYGMNNSYEHDGYLNMETGQRDEASIGLIRQWNFNNRSFAFDEGCDQVTGYLGNFFPRNYPRGKSMHFFSGDICKSVELQFVGEVEKNGLRGYTYIPDISFLDNGHHHPEKSCNCMGECFPSGVLNVSRCFDGVPMFASFPHFLDADPSYVEKFQGLNPDPHRSDFHVITEPNFGFPIELAAHIQYNILLQKNTKLSMFENVPDLVFPLFWVKKRVLMPEESVAAIKMLLFLPTLGTICAVGLVLVGLLMVSLGILPRFFRPTTHDKLRSQMLTDVSFMKIPGSEEDAMRRKFLEAEQLHQEAHEVVKLLNTKETDIMT